MVVVNVERGIVGGVECEVVDGRELHVKLGNKDEFAHWIKDRIRQLKFVENQGFETFWGISQKGRPPREYRLTLVMAKKIAMAEHTDAGNAVRDYFLDRERISYEAPASSSDIEARFERLENRMADRMERMFDRMTGLIEKVVDRAAPAQISAHTEVAIEPPKSAPRVRALNPANGEKSVTAQIALAQAYADERIKANGGYVHPTPRLQ